MAITPKVLIELGITDTNLQKRVAEARAEVERLKKSKEDLAKQNKLTATTEAQLNAEIKNATDTQRKAENQLKAFVATTKSYEGSIEQAAGVSKVLTAEFNRMSASEREATEDGKKLSAALKVANDELRNQGVATGNMRANVGNYTEAINNSLVGIRSQIQALKEENETLDITSAKFQQNKTRIEELTLQYNVASGKVDEFGDRMKKSQAAETLDSINDAGQGAASALMLFGVATGASTQASEAEKNVLMALQVVTAAYTVWKGRKIAMELADKAATKASELATRGATAAQRLFTAAVGTTTGGLNVLKIAMIGTGVLAFVAGIGALVSMMGDWTESTQTQADEQENLSSIVDDTIERLDRYSDALDRSSRIGIESIQKQIDIAKEKGASDKDLNALFMDLSDKQLERIDKLKVANESILISEGESTKKTLTDIISVSDAITDITSKLADAQFDLAAAQSYSSDQTKILFSQDYVNDLTKILKAYQNYYDLLVQADDIKTKRLLGNLDLEKKAREDNLRLLKEVVDLEAKILDKDFQYRIAKLSDNYQQEQLKLVEAKDKGVITQERYNKDSLALLTNYQAEVNRLLLEQANFEAASTNETNDAKLLAYENQLAQQKAFEQASLDSAKLYASEQEAQSKSLTDKLASDAQTQGQITADFLQGVGDLIGQSLLDTEMDVKKFSKNLLILTLDTVQKVLLAKQAEAIGGIIAAAANDPTNFLTGGASGLVKAIAFTGAIQGLFAIAKASIAKLEKGGEIPKAANGLLVGPSHANGGIPAYAPGGPIEMEGGEAVINKRSTAMFRPLLSAINEAGGGVRFANGGSIGTAARVETNIFDYNKLAAAIANIPAPVVTVEDINAGQAKFARVAQKTVL